MPASSLFPDIERNSGVGLNGGGGARIGDDRAMQLALELSMLGFNSEPLSAVGVAVGVGVPTPDEVSNDLVPYVTLGLDEVRSKKSQNMTECVPVPSSEHVAEIVGRQGKPPKIFIFFLLYLIILHSFFFSLYRTFSSISQGQFCPYRHFFFINTL